MNGDSLTVHERCVSEDLRWHARLRRIATQEMSCGTFLPSPSSFLPLVLITEIHVFTTISPTCIGGASAKMGRGRSLPSARACALRSLVADASPLAHNHCVKCQVSDVRCSFSLS